MTLFLPKLPPLEPNPKAFCFYGAGEGQNSDPSQSPEPMTQAMEVKRPGQRPDNGSIWTLFSTFGSTQIPGIMQIALLLPALLKWAQLGTVTLSPILLPPPFEFPS